MHVDATQATSSYLFQIMLHTFYLCCVFLRPHQRWVSLLSPVWGRRACVPAWLYVYEDPTQHQRFV